MRWIPLFVLALVCVARAQVALGQMNPVREIALKPGESISVPLYYYNSYGSKPVHILLSVIGGNSSWITFDPPARTVTYEVMGRTVNVTENLWVGCMGKVKELPPGARESLLEVYTYPYKGKCGAMEFEDVVAYIVSPHGPEDGYIPAKPVMVTFSVPEDAEIGDYSFSIQALANVLGELGTVQVGAAQEARYTVHVIYPGEYYERVATPTATPPSIFEIIPTEYWFVAIVILVAVFAYFLGRRR